MKAFIHWILGASLVFVSVPLLAQTRCAVESFGSVDQDPLTISGAHDLPPDCTLDFGDREVILEGSLRALNLTVLAGQMTILNQGMIEGGPGTTLLVLRQGRAHDGSADIAGGLISNGAHGGDVVVLADGSVTAAATARIEAAASDPAGYGGFIDIEAGGDILFLPDGTPCRAVGGELAEFNGEVSIISHNGSVRMSRGIDVSGGTLARGAVTIDAATGLDLGAAIRAAGHCAGGVCSRGGQVTLLSGAGLQIGAVIDASGADGAVDSGDGNGGGVRIDAAGDVNLGGAVLLSGGDSSRGGTFDAFSGGAYKQAGTIDASGRNEMSSSGGFIIISAGKDAMLAGGASASGGAAGGAGSIQVVADGLLSAQGPLAANGNSPASGIELVSVNDAIQVTGPLSARGLGDFGTGGPIGLYAVTAIDLNSTVNASGSGQFGLGGTVKLDSFQSIHLGARTIIVSNGDLEVVDYGEGGIIEIIACQVAIDPSATLHVLGSQGGGIFITSSGGMSLPGEYQAPTDGLIQIRFPPDLPPDLSGGTFFPAATLVPTDAVNPCALPTTCGSVSDLACRVDGTTVTLSWANSPSNTSVEVLRDGALAATLGPSDESFVDQGVPDGPHTYLVQGSCRGRPSSGASCEVAVSTGGVPFKRGDCNDSGDRDISDGIAVLGYLFLGLPKTVSCEKACDCNDDGGLDVSDAVFLLAYLFTDPTRIPPPPLDRCGPDLKADNLTCGSFEACSP